MKRIKTLSTISLVTVLLGLGIPGFENLQKIKAEDNKTLTPGQPLNAVSETPTDKNFDPAHTIIDNKDLSSTQTGFEAPAYQTDGVQWRLLDGAKNDQGVNTVAFERPLSTKTDFHIIAKSNIDADGGKTWDSDFSSDFVGLILTTENAKGMANNQQIPFRNGVDHAGYANATVKWETTFGTQPFATQADTWTAKGHYNFVRRTIKADQKELKKEPFKPGLFAPINISETYYVDYQAQGRKLMYSTDRSTSAKGGLATDILPDKGSVEVPEGIDRLFIGAMTAVNGNGHHDRGGLTFTKIDGMYDTTTTIIKYVDENGNKLGDPSVVTSIIGTTLSVEGNGEHDWPAPQFPNKVVDGTKESRTILTQETASDNVLTIHYKSIPGGVPYKIVDDNDANAKEIGNGKIQGSVGDKTDYTAANIKNYVNVPDNLDVVSIENGQQTITDNMNKTVIIHVKHHPVSADSDFNRNVVFVGPSGMANKPADVPQHLTGQLISDGYTGVAIGATSKDVLQKVDVPNLESKGYGIVSVKDSSGRDLGDHLANNQFTWDGLDKDFRKDVTVTVTYGPLTKLLAPDFDFGDIAAGSPQFYGQAPQLVKHYSGALEVVNTAHPEADWTLFAQLDKKDIPGDPKILLYKDMPQQISISSTISQVIDKKTAAGNSAIWTLLPSESDANGAFNKIVALKMTNLQHEKLNLTSGSTSYEGTITWTLDTVPVP